MVGLFDACLPAGRVGLIVFGEANGRKISKYGLFWVMRSEAEIQTLLLDIAKNDERIRAVLLNGSRANPNIPPDPYQDFDIVYVVNQLKSFISNHNWVHVFGERIIMQLPNEMSFGEKREEGFGYLMLLEDGNRIDLTLFPLNKVRKDYRPDSLTVCWLDKDNLFQNLPEPTDKDYLIKKPAEKEFLDTCNEFWWVSTYVAKGLLRNEITYAKEMMETVVRPMFMKIVEWYIGHKSDYTVSFGKAGRFMNEYLSPEQYDLILSTYTDHLVENNWRSLYVMTETFSELAKIVAEELKFSYNSIEDENVRAYFSILK